MVIVLGDHGGELFFVVRNRGQGWMVWKGDKDGFFFFLQFVSCVFWSCHK